MLADTAFDYIVVGAGSAGCALASRLSERARVLLLERGGPDSQPHIHDPAGILTAAFADKTIAPDEYMTEAEPGLGNRSIPISRGIVRGGCSSINGMVYVRGNPRDYDRWAELGNTGWSYQDVLPYFKRSERYGEGPSTYHDVAGPLDVRRVPDPSVVAGAFIESAAAFAAFRDSNSSFDFNGPRQQNGAGFYQVTVTPDGRRASAAVAFLDSVKDRSTLEIRTGARATEIVIERGRAVGVRCRVDGEVRVFRADGEIVVSAGAFESPRLLQLSGIGPAAQLRTLGIEPIVDLPGVGQNLHDHAMMLTYWPASRPTPPSTYIAEAGLFVHASDRSPDAPPDLQVLLPLRYARPCSRPADGATLPLLPCGLWAAEPRGDPAAVGRSRSSAEHPHELPGMRVGRAGAAQRYRAGLRVGRYASAPRLPQRATAVRRDRPRWRPRPGAATPEQRARIAPTRGPNSTDCLASGRDVQDGATLRSDGSGGSNASRLRCTGTPRRRRLDHAGHFPWQY